MDIKTSEFRTWVRNLWIENTEEHLTYNESPYNMREYWEKYKWWLKQEFKKKRNSK